MHHVFSLHVFQTAASRVSSSNFGFFYTTICFLYVDIKYGISLQGVLFGPIEKNGLKGVRQYIIIYFWLLAATIAPMPPLEAFVFFYSNMRCTICELKNKEKNENI